MTRKSTRKTTVDPRLFVAGNVGRGLLASLVLETALFAVACQDAVLGSWPAWRSTDDAYIGAFGA